MRLVALTESVRFIACLNDMTVMCQSIQQRRRELRVPEHRRLLREREVRRDDHAGALVELREQMEQQRPTGLAERQVAQLIEDHQIGVHQAVGKSALSAGRLLLLQRVDQFHGGEEAHPLAVLGDCLDAQRGRQVRLAGARTADEHDVGGRVDKLASSQLVDDRLVDLRLREVEPGQIPMHG
jgi:hypothetical protein